MITVLCLGLKENTAKNWSQHFVVGERYISISRREYGREFENIGGLEGTMFVDNLNANSNINMHVDRDSVFLVDSSQFKRVKNHG